MAVTSERTEPAAPHSVEPAAPYSLEYFHDPYPTYRWLREERPVLPITLPFGGVPVWLVSRYEDIRTCLSDHRLSSDSANASPEFRAAGLAMGAGTEWEKAFLVDPPQHTRQRKLVAKALSARTVAGWSGIIRGVVADALDAIDTEAELDLLVAFAYPMTMAVLGEVIGARATDYDQLRRWVNEVVDPDRAVAARAIRSILDYLHDLAAVKRTRLADDLLSGLITVTDGEDRLTGSEMVAIVGNLMAAALETTANLIGNAFVAFHDHPDQLRLFTGRPELIDRAIEEIQRYVGPAMHSLFKFTTTELHVAGTTIPPGQTLVFVLGAGNRDPQAFPHPDTFDITRSDGAHLGFGHGPHHCAGAPLGRQIARIALPALYERFPRISLAVPRDSLTYRINLLNRVFDSLPVTTR